MSGGSRRREPSREELELWKTVSKSVEPLKRRAKPAAGRDGETPSAREASPETAAKAKPPRPAAPAYRPAPQREPPRLAPLDRRTRAKIARGTVAIDARIDLHGLTQAAAHARLGRFLGDAQARGVRLVLVITGKGRADESPPIGQERGVLKRSVPMWLSSPEMRPYVIGFESADRSHGGEGALYVRVRSRRKAAS